MAAARATCDRPTILRGRRRIDRRANKGVAEPHMRADLDEFLSVDGSGRLSFDPERPCRTPKQRDVSSRIGSCDQQSVAA